MPNPTTAARPTIMAYAHRPDAPVPLAWRIESRCRQDDFYRGLEARTADPLWFLSRQWMLGELQGEDAGSPIRVTTASHTQHVKQVMRGASGSWKDLDETQAPLEMMIEHDAITRDDVLHDWRLRVQIGQHLERLIRAEFGEAGASDALAAICVLRQRYPIARPAGDQLIALDRATQRFLNVMAGRAMDGGKLYLDSQSASGRLDLPAGVASILGERADTVKTALGRLKIWFEAIYGKLYISEASAWVPQSLEYNFKVRAPDGENAKTLLAASSYRSGELDWHSFSIESDSSAAAENGTNTVIELVPTRVSFHGMPNPRWWAFEDRQTDFGNLDTATTDIAKMMIMDFAFIYGNDWFQVPLPVEPGTITRIRSLKVTDVFGVETEIAPARTTTGNAWEDWQVFCLSRKDPVEQTGNFLLFPPVPGFREESPPVEEVRLFRDEMANMVWAVEHQVRNRLGLPVSGFEEQIERRAREQEAELRQQQAQLDRLRATLRERLDDIEALLDGDAQTREALSSQISELQRQIAELEKAMDAVTGTAQAESSSGLPLYRLATTVPANWIPFLPVLLSESNSQVMLRHADMIRNELDELPTPIAPLTRLLAGVNGSGALEWLREEAVARAGQRYQLTRQRVRWWDGKTFVWTGRKVTGGRGEGQSGLRFDILRDKK